MTEPLPRPDVLIVEDEDAVARVLVALLERAGFEAVRAASAEDALVLLQTRVLRLGIFDVGLPGMNGFELLRVVRSRRSLERMPILMLTGSGADEDIVRAFELGVNDYLTKPFESAELIARVQRLLDAVVS